MLDVLRKLLERFEKTMVGDVHQHLHDAGEEKPKKFPLRSSCPLHEQILKGVMRGQAKDMDMQKADNNDTAQDLRKKKKI